MDNYINSFDYKLDDNEIEDILFDIKKEDNYINNPYILDTSKHNFTLIEKCIYDIALYQLKNNNIEYNENIHFIEFKYKEIEQINNFQVECDEHEKITNCLMIHPIISNILYLNNDTFPILITNLDNDSLIYKEFEGRNNFILSFPKKCKVISFESNKYYGVTNLFKELNKFEKQNFIVINVWDKKPPVCNKYSSQLINNYDKNEDIRGISKTNNNIENIEINSDILNADFFDNLFYSQSNCNEILYKIGNQIKIIYGTLLQNMRNDNSIIHIIANRNRVSDVSNNKLTDVSNNKLTDVSNNKLTDVSNNKLTDVSNNNYMVDYYNIKKNIILKENRFYQKLFFNNLYNNDMCNWILLHILSLEMEKEKETSYIKNIDNLPFFKFILTSIKNIIDKIIFFYNIDFNSRNINIKKISFSKISSPIDNNVNLITEGFLSIDILLNDINEIIFQDNIKFNQTAGDVVVYCNILTSYKVISKNKRYCINIIVDFE
jgi:hypothetical protein